MGDRSIETLTSARPYPLWWDDIARKPTRPPMPGPMSADVAIVGGGFTGLWTALSLAQQDPERSIVVVERDFIGYGASGRNGGWCYAGFAAGLERIEALAGSETASRWGRLLIETLDNIENVVAAERIDCGFHRGGTLELLRNGGQQARAAAHIGAAHRLGWTEEDIRLLSLADTTQRVRASGVLGAQFSPHTAVIHPARLVTGLAAAAERHGVTIFENTAATSLESGLVGTNHGALSAPIVVRSTDGYTAELNGHDRDLAPLYSLMLATEPLSKAMWNDIGLADRETFGDYRHMVVYGQRTADDRIAFGGRGAPYDFGSRIRRGAEFSADHHIGLWKTLVELFPVLDGVAITHRWGGVLGVARDWMPRVHFDPYTGLAWAGGYVGSGVAATNIAGRTLADLILGKQSELIGYPWVNLPLRTWEPEPLRWLGISVAQKAMEVADLSEGMFNKPSRVASAVWNMIDH